MASSLRLALEGGTVRVGTENRAKLGAVEAALRALAARYTSEGGGESESRAETGLSLDGGVSPISVVPVELASAVPEQPIGLEQIVEGARHRARGALASGPCVLAVGIEDGLVRLGDLGTDNVGCAWVTDGSREGHGLSAAFSYPPGCLEPALREQAPIGALFDSLWRRHRAPRNGEAVAPSGRNEGNIGKLTGGSLSRSEYAAQAVLCALVPFLHVDLYA